MDIGASFRLHHNCIMQLDLSSIKVRITVQTHLRCLIIAYFWVKRARLVSMKCWIYSIYDGLTTGGEIKHKPSRFLYFGGYKTHYHLMALSLVMHSVQSAFGYFTHRSNMLAYRSLKQCIKYAYFRLSLGSIKHTVQKLRAFDYHHAKIDQILIQSKYTYSLSFRDRSFIILHLV